MEPQGEKGEQMLDYYQSYCRLLEANKTLKCELESMVKSRQQILDQVQGETTSKKQHPQYDVGTIEEKVFVKRKSSIFPRIHMCPFSQCEKAYSSQISLKMHIKIRHPSVYEQWLEQKQSNDLQTKLSQLNINEKLFQQQEGQSKKYKEQSSSQGLSTCLKISTNSIEKQTKRKRRRQPLVLRTNICPMNACDKSYAALGSLHQHIKIRHPQIYQKWVEENGSEDLSTKLSQLSLNDSKMNE